MLARARQPIEVVRPFIGIEVIVAQELESAAVKLVGAGLQADIDNSAEEMAVLGAGIIGDDVHFLDCVNARRIGDVVVDEFVVVHAIQNVVIGLLAIAVQVRPRRVKGLLAGIEGCGANSDRAGNE